MILASQPTLTNRYPWVELTNFAISKRGPIICNTVLDTTLKEIESLPLFKA